MADSPLFKCHDLTEHAEAIAKYLPGGPLFEAAHAKDTIFNMFLRGIGRIDEEVEGFLKLFDSELDINTTTAFLVPWEDTLGIGKPGDCFSRNEDIQTRRQQVLIKLAALGVQTEQDFVDLAALYGIEIALFAGAEVGLFTFTFPFFFFNTPKQARFTMVVFYEVAQAFTFTYTFPIVFGNAAIPILECLFRQLAPGNVDVIFRQVDEIDPLLNKATNLGFSDGFS